MERSPSLGSGMDGSGHGFLGEWIKSGTPRFLQHLMHSLSDDFTITPFGPRTLLNPTKASPPQEVHGNLDWLLIFLISPTGKTSRRLSGSSVEWGRRRGFLLWPMRL